MKTFKNMMKRKLYRIVVCIILCYMQSFSTEGIAEGYIWPTDASQFITSSFGEFRARHFHSGIDIKTWNKTGYKVFAADSGYVWRIVVSPFGYGKVIYLKHPDKQYSVYAHLDKFAPRIQNIVEREQERRIKYSVEMFFKEGEIVVKKGEFIAYTGRSGTDAPHLHFEIRDTLNRPLNPLTNGFSAPDKENPTPQLISFTPLNYQSHVNRDWKPMIIPAVRVQADKFKIQSTPILKGDIGVGISCYDRNGEVTNRFNPLTLRLIIDGEESFRVEYQRTSFETTHKIELDRDFRLLRRGIGRFHNLYRLPENDLLHYGNSPPFGGVIRAWEKGNGGIGVGDHTIAIELMDAAGNRSICSGKFRVLPRNMPSSLKSKLNSESTKNNNNTPISGDNFFIIPDFYTNYVRFEINSKEKLKDIPTVIVENEGGRESQFDVFPKDKQTYVTSLPLTSELNSSLIVTVEGEAISGKILRGNYQVNLQYISRRGERIKSDDNMCFVDFPTASLYSPIWGKVSIVSPPQSNNYDFVGKIYDVQPFDVPLNNPGAIVTLKCPSEVAVPDKLGIYYIEDEEWIYLRSNYDIASRSFTTTVKSLESFILIRDDEPPEINIIQPKDRAVIKSKRPLIIFSIIDKISGIKGEESINVLLDGKKVVSEYDPPRKRVLFRPNRDIEPGTHRLEIIVQDQVNNQQHRIFFFTIQ